MVMNGMVFDFAICFTVNHIKNFVYSIFFLIVVPLFFFAQNQAHAVLFIDSLNNQQDLKFNEDDDVQIILEKEKKIRECIASEQTIIEEYRRKIFAIENRIGEVINEKYRILGINEQDVLAVEKELHRIDQNLSLLIPIDATNLPVIGSKIESYSNELKQIGNFSGIQLKMLHPLFTKIYAKLQDTKQKCMAAGAAKSEASHTVYTVLEKKQDKDCLYKIAKQLYGDGLEWYRIYEANKELIDSTYETYKKNRKNAKIMRPEDLIIPFQVLKIPQ